MAKLNYFYFLLIIFTIEACTTQEAHDDLQITTNVESHYSEIIQKANSYFAQLSGNTRSSLPRIYSIEKVGQPYTRTSKDSALNTPIYYIVNYENEEGFVMVGGNESAENMVAISDEGNLNLSDTINNPGLSYFIDGIISPGIPDTVQQLNPILFLDVNVPPLLNIKVRKWGEDKPFNYYTPVKDGKHTKVGCAAVAMGMIMSYYEWPNYYGLDWYDIIHNLSSKQLSQLLASLGQPAALNMVYGIDQSYCNIDNYPNAFAFMAYEMQYAGQEISNFDFSSNERMKEQLPVIIWGKSENSYNEYGHTWVIDGVLKTSEQSTVNPERTINKYFMHCVWGNYGKANGYFKIRGFGVHDILGGERDYKDVTDGVYGLTDESSVALYKKLSRIYKVTPKKPFVEN